MLCKPSSRRPSSHRLRARAGAGRRNLARRVDRRSYASSCVSSQRVCNESRPQTQAAVTKVATGFHCGQQFSITALTNGGGTITERYAYDAYGTPTITDASGVELTSSSENNRYLYTGREYDEALGLYHYRTRMYDSVAGRFCSRDPIRFWGSKWSLYEFVEGSPTIAIDPFGLQVSYPVGVGQAIAAGWSAQEIATAFGITVELAANLIAAKKLKDAVDNLVENIECNAKGKDKCAKAKNGVKQAEKSLKSAQKQIDQHQGYIDDPSTYPGGIQISIESAIEKWKKDIKKHEGNVEKYKKVKEILEQKVKKYCPKDIPFIPFF